MLSCVGMSLILSIIDGLYVPWIRFVKLVV
jgi:hypothetical protein